MFESDHSHILRELAFTRYIFFEFFEGGEQCEKKKSRIQHCAPLWWTALDRILWNTTLLHFFMFNIIYDIIKYIISNISFINVYS